MGAHKLFCHLSREGGRKKISGETGVGGYKILVTQKIKYPTP